MQLLQERQPPCADDFLYICDDAYTRDQLLGMEEKMLKQIGFDIGMPLFYRFLRRYAKVSVKFLICSKTFPNSNSGEIVLPEVEQMKIVFSACLPTLGTGTAARSVKW